MRRSTAIVAPRSPVVDGSQTSASRSAVVRGPTMPSTKPSTLRGAPATASIGTFGPRNARWLQRSVSAPPPAAATAAAQPGKSSGSLAQICTMTSPPAWSLAKPLAGEGRKLPRSGQRPVDGGDETRADADRQRQVARAHPGQARILAGRQRQHGPAQRGDDARRRPGEIEDERQEVRLRGRGQHDAGLVDAGRDDRGGGSGTIRIAGRVVACAERAAPRQTGCGQRSAAQAEERSSREWPRHAASLAAKRALRCTAMRPGALRTAHTAILVSALAVAGLAGCGGGDDAGEQPVGSPATIRVPQDAQTIAAAVARAKPGDLVLVGPGVYHETVEVKTPRVTLRGLDRSRVIIDGDVVRPNGVVLTADGGAVQNLTVRNAVLNGVLVSGSTDAEGNGIGNGSAGYSRRDAAKSPPLNGFVVDHVTSYNNGLYGIYAFNARGGLIENTYTSGMADSGIYVGQCEPCDIAVRSNVAERNAVGYEGANTNGRMYVYANRFVGNRVGATTGSEHQEAFVPQDDAVVAGNVIAANSEARTPAQAEGGFGIGLGISGGTNNTLSHNLIESNPVAGLVLTNADDLPPIANRIARNSFRSNGVDVLYAPSTAAGGTGNCLSENRLTTVRPKSLPRSCPARGAAPKGAQFPPPRAPKGVAFTDVQPPPRLPSLPAAATAPAPQPGRVTLPTIRLPAPDLLEEQSRTRW